MSPRGTGPRALYLHVPFCSTRCDYCAFHSLAGRSAEAMGRVTAATLGDIDRLASWMPTIETIYVGGGTPTALPDALLLSLVRRPIEFGAQPREITVEANPESCPPPLLDSLASSRVTRLSIGVQTLEPAAARGLGRRLTSSEEVATIRRAWPGILSVDLIHGAPGSTTDGFRASIETLIELGVDHFSIYGLGVEPDTPLFHRVREERLHLPEPDDWQEIVRLVTGSGLRRYEVSSFGRPAAESLHNDVYWSADHYLGLGPSAVSTLELDGRVVRITQPADHARFIARSHPFDAEREPLSKADRRLEYAMLGLRRRAGIRLEPLTGGRTAAQNEALLASISSLCANGLLVHEGQTVRPTDRGMDLLNQVINRLNIDT
ncbi:MAG: coproporphyrinogen-III oxidase family protein [Spirochaetota bacterium]